MRWLAPSEPLSLERAAADQPAIDRILRSSSKTARHLFLALINYLPAQEMWRSVIYLSFRHDIAPDPSRVGRIHTSRLLRQLATKASGRGAVLGGERLLSGAHQRGVCKE